MNYLVYIERAAENLQFFLWYRDYSQRFAKLPLNEQVLAPAWCVDKANADTNATHVNMGTSKGITPDAAAVFKDTDFAGPKVTVMEYNNSNNPFHTPPATPDGRNESTGRASERVWSVDGTTLRESVSISHQNKAAGAFEAADIKLQPCQYPWFSMFLKCVKIDDQFSYNPAFS